MTKLRIPQTMKDVKNILLENGLTYINGGTDILAIPHSAFIYSFIRKHINQEDFKVFRGREFIYVEVQTLENNIV